MATKLPRWLLGTAVAVYFFLHVPILVLVIFSFNNSKFSVDWRGFTFNWYHRLLERPDIIRGLKASLIVGSLSTIISAVLGTLLALALARHKCVEVCFLRPACAKNRSRSASSSRHDAVRFLIPVRTSIFLPVGNRVLWIHTPG